MNSRLVTATLLALTALTQLSCAQTCCTGCYCSTQTDCMNCYLCDWTTAGCVPGSGNYVPSCCADCSCLSPGECEMCGCCVDWNTYVCFSPPCVSTTSTTGSTVSSTIRQRTTTTSVTSTTHYPYPKAGDFITPTTTSTTTTTTSTSTTTTQERVIRPPATTTTIPKPSCTDGIQNQGERWIDCGGPCRPCVTADVKLSLDNPPDVEKGSVFQVKVRVRPNRTGSYRVDVKLPEGFEARERTIRDVKIEAGQEVEVGLDVDATDYLRKGDYTLRAQVRDNRDLPAADSESTIEVQEPVVIKTPLGSVKLPSARRMREIVRQTQERIYNILNNTTQVFYSLRWLWAAIIMCLFGLLYVYHMWRSRS